MDFHQHGPLREFEGLGLSRLASSPQCERAHYAHRAAIMYNRRHHWAYLHSKTLIFVSEAANRVANPADLKMVALCARIYEQILPAVQAPMRTSPMQQDVAANRLVLTSAPRQELTASAEW